MVEHSTINPEFKGLNPAAAWHLKKWYQDSISGSTVVEHSTTIPEIKGLNPAAPGHLTKWQREINMCNYRALVIAQW